MKAIKFLIFATVFACSILPANAQDTQKTYVASGVYNVKFVVSELENGKVTNQRMYTAVLREERKAVLKTGNRVPVATGSSNNLAPVQWQYLDVGFNVDATISEREGRIDLSLSADISTVVPPDPASPTPGNSPLIRQVREDMSTSLLDGKPTVVASMDDVNTKKTVQLEVTVTKIKRP